MVNVDTVKFSDWNSIKHGSCSACIRKYIWLTDYNFSINEELLLKESELKDVIRLVHIWLYIGMLAINNYVRNCFHLNN